MDNSEAEKKIEEAFRQGKARMFLKLAAMFAACITAAVVIACSSLGSTAMVLLPLLVSLLPLGMGIYYGVLIKRGSMKITVAVITDVRRDIVGGLISGVSLRHKKYYFEYTDDEGASAGFWISRGGWLTGYSVGQAYLCISSRRKPLGADNFYEAVVLGKAGMDRQ